MVYIPRGRPRGRPPIGLSSSPINIRLRHDQYTWLQQAAHTYGISKSDVLRKLFDRVLEIDGETEGYFAEELLT